LVAVVIFPLLSTIISLLCAWVLGRDAIRRPRPDKVIWAIAFLLFALAAGADAAGRELGWTPWLAKLYYATGPALVVMFLAIGELYLLGPARMKRFGIGLTAILTAFWLSLVLGAPIDESRLASDGWDAIQRDGFMTVTTIVLNTVSTLIIVGGTGYTVWDFARKGIMRIRMIGCAWILVGTLFVAAGGSLTRLGHYEYLYIAMSIGVGMIFYGVICTRRPDARPATQSAAGLVSRPTPPLPTIEAEPHPDHDEPAMAYVASLLRQDADDVSRLCAEWSVPMDDRPVFSRSEARHAWVFRRQLPKQSQPRFDALPVPARRQLATLYREVLTWPDEEHRETPPASFGKDALPEDVAAGPGNGAADSGSRKMNAGTSR
jgi:energy-converting hydrogenase Eha subunit A